MTMADIQGAPLSSYSPEDQAFYRFWYGHMQNDLMQPPLANIAHVTARYIWDAARSAGAACEECGGNGYLTIYRGEGREDCEECGGTGKA